MRDKEQGRKGRAGRRNVRISSECTRMKQEPAQKFKPHNEGLTGGSRVAASWSIQGSQQTRRRRASHSSFPPRPQTQTLCGLWGPASVTCGKVSEVPPRRSQIALHLCLRLGWVPRLDTRPRVCPPTSRGRGALTKPAVGVHSHVWVWAKAPLLFSDFWEWNHGVVWNPCLALFFFKRFTDLTEGGGRGRGRGRV